MGSGDPILHVRRAIFDRKWAGSPPDMAKLRQSCVEPWATPKSNRQWPWSRGRCARLHSGRSGGNVGADNSQRPSADWASAGGVEVSLRYLHTMVRVTD